MIIKRKLFSLFGNLFNKKNQKQQLPVPNYKWDGNVDYSPITFKEMEDDDYYPSLVVMGLKISNNPMKLKEEWKELFDNLNNKGLFNGNKYNIMAARKLSDNIKGNNGLSCYYIKFTPDTDINSGIRLSYGDRLKWADDFAYNYWSWFKSGKY